MSRGFTRFENDEVDTDDVPPAPADGPPGTQISLDDLPNDQDLHPQPDPGIVHPTSTGVANLALTPLPSADELGQTPPHPSDGPPPGQENAPPPPYSILSPGGTSVISSQPLPGPVDMHVTSVPCTDDSPDISNYSWWEYLLATTCCIPCGIIHLIVHFCVVRKREEAGDYEGATRALKTAYIMYYSAALIVLIIASVLSVVYIFLNY
ncbi:proline-rich receptor-like protein kinase PERK12 [Patiria miniata]|uniref:Uncharacterized protein n=1 Tax=Patiria miniata TaxID=46514 RepID=A0A913ZPF5_PATMI|nr:proline-rich receptor-like protein kinase PERK12 [Patiria miniata]